MSHTVRIREKVLSVAYRAQYMRAIETTGPEPEKPGDAPIVIFLPAGLKYSVGPGRLFVHYARKLALNGFICYRFDPLGIGISDGSLEAGPVHKAWNFIEKGGFVEELTFFIHHVREKYPERKVVICGLCGGAITAILLAHRYPELVDGVISINIEPFFSTALSRTTGDKTITHINSVMKNYTAKIFSGTAWRRLFSLQSDVRGILRIGMLFLTQNRKRKKRGLQEFKNLNHPLATAFSGMQQDGTEHLMLFSEHSRCWHDFQETFFTYLMDSKTTAPFQEIRVIDQANHELQFEEWRMKAFDYIEKWLQRNFST